MASIKQERRHLLTMNLYLGLFVLSIGIAGQCDAFLFDFGGQTSNLASMKEEIHRHTDVAKRLIDLSVHSGAVNQSYNRLEQLVDKFGPRISGSRALEDAIDYLVDEMRKDGLENVHTEEAMVPHWVRGQESAMLVRPRMKTLAILGLGSSIGTPSIGLQAEAIVVKSFDELESLGTQQVQGKIVVYNQPWMGYGSSVQYRTHGASRAASLGAVATLIRSVTPFSINTPHTGIQFYNASVPKIPTACITVEDAELMQRFVDKGERLEIFLKMSAINLPMVTSRNTVAEIVGSTHPEQVVVVSGHLDSWDVGQGAVDDGAGVIIAWQALSLIRQLGLRPKRTIRAVFWTSEEHGGQGAESYYKDHEAELGNFSFVFESDSGVFKPKGLIMSGNADAQTLIKEMFKLLNPLNITQLVNATGRYMGGDNIWAVRHGIPGAELSTENEKYFYFHHTEGDTLTVLDPADLDAASAMWSVLAYVIADMDGLMPRDFKMNVDV